MGILPNGIGRGGLGRTEGGAIGREWSTEKGINQGRVEYMGIDVIEWSMDWKASFTSYAWSILWAAMYQASRLVLADRPKGIVAI